MTDFTKAERAKIKKFEAAHGLKADGKLDDKTVNAMLKDLKVSDLKHYKKDHHITGSAAHALVKEIGQKGHAREHHHGVPNHRKGNAHHTVAHRARPQVAPGEQEVVTDNNPQVVPPQVVEQAQQQVAGQRVQNADAAQQQVNPAPTPEQLLESENAFAQIRTLLGKEGPNGEPAQPAQIKKETDSNGQDRLVKMDGSPVDPDVIALAQKSMQYIEAQIAVPENSEGATKTKALLQNTLAAAGVKQPAPATAVDPAMEKSQRAAGALIQALQGKPAEGEAPAIAPAIAIDQASGKLVPVQGSSVLPPEQINEIAAAAIPYVEQVAAGKPADSQEAKFLATLKATVSADTAASPQPTNGKSGDGQNAGAGGTTGLTTEQNKATGGVNGAAGTNGASD